ncbi:MAG TPA: hypothetical protein GYA07_04845 [Verrucomicrobia bacterium]|nr:hypothetical protein [Verrucomicrobiota bacterium]HOP96397.1 hypothetical protein [Verrucomicrobiota bacterium]HPU56678.1 hypothetical protein [Verrucomicrobiota bacterium]
MMRLVCLVGMSLLLVAGGCSREDSVDAGAVASPENATAAPAVQTPEAANLDLVQQALEQKNFVQAANLLSETQPAVQRLSDDERAKYRQQVMTTTQELLQRLDDPQAKAAYERMARAITGR